LSEPNTLRNSKTEKNVDHYSRRCMGVAVFKTVPTSEFVRAFLGRAIHTAGRSPKYIILRQGLAVLMPRFQTLV